MKILLIVHHFPPDVNSTGVLMEQLFEDLEKQGHEISVITTFPHYEDFKVWPEYKGKFRQTSAHKGMGVTRVYSYTSGNKSMKRRLVNYLTFNLMALSTGLFSRRRPDAVFCTNGSFFSGVTGWLIARTRSARLIYNLQDLYPEVPVAQGQLKSRRAIRILGAIERFMYKRADHISAISPSFENNLREKGVPSEKISVIPNFVDTEFIRPLPKTNDFSRRNGLLDKVVFTHAGNIGYVYALDALVKAADQLRDRSDIVFLIIGEGVAKGDLQRTAEQMKLGNARFLPFQPRADLPEIRAASDVQLVLYKKGAASFSMPSKVYEAMASGRPVLAMAEMDSDISHLVQETECGVCIEPGDPNKLAQAIAELADDATVREAMGESGRQAAMRNYSRERVLKQYLDLLEKVCGS